MYRFTICEQHYAKPTVTRFWYSLPFADAAIRLKLFGVRLEHYPLDPIELNPLPVKASACVSEIRRKFHVHPLARAMDCIEDSPFLGGFVENSPRRVVPIIENRFGRYQYIGRHAQRS